ncbi:hypothetical protein C8F04DRAFT_1195819 [Mycena alexandri]|uniref:Uncharacterized protein n=1 Tax=Mycena alexandri TaxID=1745969 RepID=A0AAD6WQB9_9AGAR|nr:hypothetical protein C8F04DRAFT_1195819 [Mycena alexandri]
MHRRYPVATPAFQRPHAAAEWSGRTGEALASKWRHSKVRNLRNQIPGVSKQGTVHPMGPLMPHPNLLPKKSAASTVDRFGNANYNIPVTSERGTVDFRAAYPGLDHMSFEGPLQLDYLTTILYDFRTHINEKFPFRAIGVSRPKRVVSLRTCAWTNLHFATNLIGTPHVVANAEDFSYYFKLEAQSQRSQYCLGPRSKFNSNATPIELQLAFNSLESIPYCIFTQFKDTLPINQDSAARPRLNCLQGKPPYIQFVLWQGTATSFTLKLNSFLGISAIKVPALGWKTVTGTRGPVQVLI